MFRGRGGFNSCARVRVLLCSVSSGGGGGKLR
ncbi:hypothetical protein Tco_0944489, partial [Tanacetum coccineum]